MVHFTFLFLIFQFCWDINWHAALYKFRASQVALVVKNLPANAGDVRDQVQSLDWEDPLEEGMATHFSILAWRIQWTEELHGQQSMGSQRVRHNWSDLAAELKEHDWVCLNQGWRGAKLVLVLDFLSKLWKGKFSLQFYHSNKNILECKMWQKQFPTWALYTPASPDGTTGKKSRGFSVTLWCNVYPAAFLDLNH